MAKDYKHSKRRTSSSGLSGMAGFVCGLALGLAVALGVYLFDRRTEARLTAQQTAAPMTRDEAKAHEDAVSGKRAVDASDGVLMFSRRFEEELRGTAPDTDLADTES